MFKEVEIEDIHLLPCHFNWKFDESKFNERMERNLATCLEQIESSPDATVYNFLGYLYYKRKEFSEAEKYFKTCLEKYSDDSVALANLVHLYKFMGQESKVKKFIEMFNVLDEKDKNRSLGCQYWSKAYSHVRLFEYKEAIIEYDNAIKYLPNEYKLYLYKGILLNRKKEFDTAIKCLLKVEEFAEKDYLIYMQLARSYSNLKRQKSENFKIALEYFEKALLLAPNDETLLKWFGECLVKRKQSNQEALLLFNKSIELRPTSSAYHNRAILYKHREDYKKSQEDLEFALKLQPSNYYAAFDLIEIYFLTKQPEKVINLCLKLPEKIHENNPKVLFYWAEALNLETEPVGAEKKYLACLAYKKDNDYTEKAKKKLIDYYKLQFEQTKIEESLKILVAFLLKQNEHQEVKNYIEKNTNLFLENHDLHYYASQLYIIINDSVKSGEHLKYAFMFAKTDKDKFRCHEIYLQHAKNTEFIKNNSEYLKLYEEFERAYHENDKPLWCANFNFFYPSKHPEKRVKLMGNDIHSTLNIGVKELRNQTEIKSESKKNKKINYANVRINFIVSDRPHKKSGNHGRKCISIDLNIKEVQRTPQNSSITSHVSDYYKFKINNKGFKPRSDSLLNDVLISKPLSKHKDIIEQFNNDKNDSFHRNFHCSERALYGYLSQPENIYMLIEGINKETGGQTHIKIYAMILDIHSERYLCNDCQESMFFWYNPKGQFIQKLTHSLQENGHIVKTKSGLLDCIVRVSAEYPGYMQKVIEENLHKNTELDIKALCSPYNVTLLQRDDSQVIHLEEKDPIFRNIKKI